MPGLRNKTLTTRASPTSSISRPGALIVTDNVIRDGAVIDPDHRDDRVQGVRRFHAIAASDSRVTATAIQTVGSKGYDGLSFAVVR